MRALAVAGLVAVTTLAPGRVHASGGGAGSDDDRMPTAERDAVERGFNAAQAGVPPYEDMMLADVKRSAAYLHVATAELHNTQGAVARRLALWCRGTGPECIGAWYESGHLHYAPLPDASYDGGHIRIDLGQGVVIELRGSTPRTRQDVELACRMRDVFRSGTPHLNFGSCSG